MIQNPDLELVDVRQDESFTVWSHGYPYRTVRWHFHPEYEIQLVTATSGKYFVGDFIGNFEPGNLVLLGPNLPHNWVSEMAPDETVAERGLIIQFSADFIGNCIHAFPELKSLQRLLSAAQGGQLFSAATGEQVTPVFRELLSARGFRRVQLFLSLLDCLVKDQERRPLASPGYMPDALAYMSSTFNHVLAYIGENLATDLREATLAELCKQSVSTFSRSFRKHTGMSFVQYVNRLRINVACEMLMDGDASITDICFLVGFNNVSNFNRQFLEQKGVSPSRFRKYQEINMATRSMAAADSVMTASA
ncbi:MAG: AraC family transcriptional regulator [Collimonas pratensis]|uniref:AraC family transcriptional regulator n=1 Tax=Collimonas pratensis TaxID=279113 RepID=UPI003C76EFEE